MEITPEDLGGLLFAIHSHGELCDPEAIVYTEDELIKVLKAIGLPSPIWGASLTIKQYKAKRGDFKVDLINEAISDVVLISHLNSTVVAKRLIKEQFVVIAKEDAYPAMKLSRKLGKVRRKQ